MCNRKYQFLILSFSFLLCSVSSFSQINFSTSPVWQAVPARYPTGSGWADLNGDGSLDLVVSCGLDVANAPAVAYFNRSGILSADPDWRSTYLSAYGCLYLGDLDNDGDTDLMIASLGITSAGLPLENHAIFLNSNGLSILPDWLSPLGNGFSGTGGDVDGDGDIDLAFGQGDWLTNHLQPTTLLLNSGGTFGVTPDWKSDLGYFADEVVFADVDNDGDLDLALGNERQVNGVGIAIFSNVRGVLETTPSWTTSAVTGGRQMAFGDVDQDGFLDLAVASPQQRFYLFRNRNGVLETTPSWNSNSASEPSAVAWADVDGDGDLDLGAGAWSSGTGVFENINGSLTTNFVKTRSTGQGTQQIAWADFDEDGLVPMVQEFQGNGTRKLFYLKEQPIHAVSSIRIDDQPLKTSQYCYDLVSGWISLGVAPDDEATLKISYVISKDPDLAVTNWEKVKVYANTSILTGIGAQSIPHGTLPTLNTFPNPVYGYATIEYEIPLQTKVQISVINSTGLIYKLLADENKAPGKYHLTLNTDGLAAGIYYLCLRAEGYRLNKKLLLGR